MSHSLKHRTNRPQQGRMTPLDEALRHFEAAEANLRKLEALWDRIRAMVPDGPAFGAPDAYEHSCLAFRTILGHVPAIDGYRVVDALHDYDAIGQRRIDALEVGELDAQAAVQREIEEQSRHLREYRFRLQSKRAQLVRDRLQEIIDVVDAAVGRLAAAHAGAKVDDRMPEPLREQLHQASAEIEGLLGSQARPPRWQDFKRHLGFWQVQDAIDIASADWPTIREHLLSTLYGEHDPIPVQVDDLGTVVAARPRGPLTHQLLWQALSAEDFERLMYLLFSETSGYENAAWLQKTTAADRGRDLSVTRVVTDSLSSVRRMRTIVQCKHWLARSVGPVDVGQARDQMQLWHPPRVDELIIATSGRFTADAIQLVETHNQGDRALTISMWPESHLERLLSARPHLIAHFRLRG